EGGEPRLRLPVLCVCFGQQPQSIGPWYLCSRGLCCDEPLVHLGQPCVGLALCRHGPSVHHLRQRQVLGEAVLLTERHGRGGLRVHHRYLPAAQMEDRRKTDGYPLAEGMCQLVRQGQRRGTLPPRLVRVAAVPQRRGEIAATRHGGIETVEGSLAAGLLRVVQGQTMLKVGTSRGKGAGKEQRDAQRVVGFEQGSWLLGVLRHVQELLTELTRRF